MMKTEDYLWDKTGEDPEIERLENALQVFRYKEAAAPEMPAKVLPFTQKKETPRSFFRFAYAAAACIAFVALALGVWFQISNKKIDVAATNPAETVAETVAPQTENKVTDEEVFVAETDESTTRESNIETAKPTIARKIVKIKKPIYKNRFVARNTKAKGADADKLTKEEKYAYDQLMLALSITSSKLKLVSDKIENTEKGNR
jgi:hypothetical protein